MDRMLYGPMTTAQHLISIAESALVPLFQAYAIERERGVRWRAEMDAQMGFDKLTPLHDLIQSVGMYGIACCVALLSDNVARVWSMMVLEDEKRRKEFGPINAGETLGTLLWAAGNTARHYDGGEFLPGTETVLARIGVSDRDESTTFQILEKAGIGSLDDLVPDLEALCEEIESAAPAWRSQFAERWGKPVFMDLLRG